MNNSQNMGDILKAVMSGKAGQGNVDELVASLNEEQQKKLSQVLNDKEQTEKILSSPMARQLLQALLGDKNG